jgi:PAS domain S-box-containing protein
VEKLRILNLEDNPNDVELNQAFLESEGFACTLVCVDNREDFLRALQKKDYDIILADYSLPSFDGLSALTLARENSPETPFIFVSGTLGEDVAIEAMKRGATDYIIKDRLERLPTAVRRALTEKKDQAERRRAEEALRRSEGRLRQLIGQTFDIIFETDAFGFIKTISPQSEQVFGLAPEALIGRHFQEFLKESDRERVLDRFHQAVKKEWTGIVEFIGKRKDGAEVYCEMRHVVEEENGRVLGTLGVIRDVTERHKMQAHLQQSQKMEAIGTLAGGIAHDFNNILGAIIGYTQLALYDLPTDSPLRYNFDQVLKASDRARELVKQILSFSRQTPQEQGPIHILPVLKEGLKLLRASLPKSIDIKKNLSIKEDVIIGDPTQIHQVIMNLCTNASQAIGGRPGLIEINLEEVNLGAGDQILFPGLKEGPYLRLSVRDTGSGIEANILPRIFDPFFTTKAPGLGTGMGLSVVHGIVKSHGGEITVYSEPGVGTTFRIYLPQIKRPPISEQKDPGPLPTGNERILFVDDEPAMVESWVSMLTRLGYQVSSRTDSIEALALFRTDPQAFDMVITDQTMPRMSGAELAKQMITLRGDLPVILCSGYSETLSPEAARDLGIRKFLMKPVLLGELAVSIRRVLDDNG